MSSEAQEAASLLLTAGDLPDLDRQPRRFQCSSRAAVCGGAVLLAEDRSAELPPWSETAQAGEVLGEAEDEGPTYIPAWEVLGEAEEEAQSQNETEEAAQPLPEEEEETEPPTEPPQEVLTCAAKEQEDCSKSKCCLDVGYQCYAKTEYWAVCLKACDADGMQKFDPKKEEWSCEPLGERTRCAKEGEECSKFGSCCEEPGAVCYEKNEFWSSCMQGCDSTAMKASDPHEEDWSCRELGERNYKSKCSWAGQDCLKTKCCNNNGFTCLVKDEDFAGCRQTTEKSTWFDKKVPVPGDWDGTALGYGRTEYAVQPVPEGQPIQGASLFCVMVYLPNSTEESLMWLAKKNGVSIFGCNESMTLHAWRSAAAGWDTGEATLVNTDVFQNAFEKIKEDGRYKKWDWTVKADPDCVFFADRLMGHLWGLRAPPYVPIYIKNNGVDPGLGNDGFLGAIEIFSKAAMQTYFANAKECGQYLGVNSGEDGFFKSCMDALAVGYMTDANIFTPDYDPSACRQGQRVAFHPLKAYKEYQCCVDLVMGIPRNPVYGKCDDDDGSIKRPWFKENP